MAVGERADEPGPPARPPRRLQPHQSRHHERRAGCAAARRRGAVGKRHVPHPGVPRLRHGNLAAARVRRCVRHELRRSSHPNDLRELFGLLQCLGAGVVPGRDQCEPSADVHGCHHFGRLVQQHAHYGHGGSGSLRGAGAAVRGRARRGGRAGRLLDARGVDALRAAGGEFEIFVYIVLSPAPLFAFESSHRTPQSLSTATTTTTTTTTTTNKTNRASTNSTPRPTPTCS